MFSPAGEEVTSNPVSPPFKPKHDEHIAPLAQEEDHAEEAEEAARKRQRREEPEEEAARGRPTMPGKHDQRGSQWGSDEVHQEDNLDEEEGRRPKMQKNPANPTTAEVEEHNKTYLPFRS